MYIKIQDLNEQIPTSTESESKKHAQPQRCVPHNSILLLQCLYFLSRELSARALVALTGPRPPWVSEGPGKPDLMERRHFRGTCEATLF